MFVCILVDPLALLTQSKWQQLELESEGPILVREKQCIIIDSSILISSLVFVTKLTFYVFAVALHNTSRATCALLLSEFTIMGNRREVVTSQNCK